MFKRLLVIAALLTVLILIGGGILWMRTEGSVRPRYTLSNGTTVTFYEATFGTNHVLVDRKGWQKYLPRFLARNRGSTLSSHTTQSPVMMLWYEQTKLAGITGEDFACSLLHADGTETAFNPNRYYARSTPTNSIIGSPSPYPQREKNLRVRVYDRPSYNKLDLLGEFTVRNPRVSKVPMNPAPPLPQTSSDGNLTVTLTSLEGAVRRNKYEKTNFMALWTHARFEITEAGEPTTKWKVEKMIAVDSISNRLESYSWSSGAEKGMKEFHCQPTLWPSESYKLRFEFSREAEAFFDENEIWTIRGVAMPADGEFTLVNTQWNSGPFTVAFHGINSKDGQPPWQKQYSGEASLGFSIVPPLKDHRFTILALTDQTGRKVDTTGSGYSSTNWGFRFVNEQIAETLNVTMALHRSRFVEFHAQPAKWEGEYSR